MKPPLKKHRTSSHTTSCHIAIDAMSGDHGPEVVVAAVIESLRLDPHLQITLVGDLTALKILLPILPERCHLIASEEVVRMEDDPIQAVRQKKRSSMRIALDLLAAHEVQAVLSAGNTGALMAMARFVIGMMAPIERPALLYTLPTLGGQRQCVDMLDLGANVVCTAEQLLQFAIMGQQYACTAGIEKPRIALLNIGTESTKGREEIRVAARLIQARSDLNYVGFLEGHHIYQDRADVIVCDGFTGNIALKTSEGVAKLLFAALKQHFQATYARRFLAWMAQGVFRSVKQQFDPEGHNGAPLLGLKQLVVKSHGHAHQAGWQVAIQQTTHNVRMELIQHLEQALHTPD